MKVMQDGAEVSVAAEVAHGCVSAGDEDTFEGGELVGVVGKCREGDGVVNFGREGFDDVEVAVLFIPVAYAGAC